MKLFTVLFLALSLSATSFAEQPPLKDNMKAIGNLFKEISDSLNDSSQNSRNAADADQLAHLFGLVIDQTPDLIDKLPAQDQAAALADYRVLIQDEITSAGNLARAFLGNDNPGAATILRHMGTIAKNGHGKYRPKDGQ